MSYTYRNTIKKVEDLTDEDWKFIKMYAEYGGRSWCVQCCYKHMKESQMQDAHNMGKGLLTNRIIKAEIDKLKANSNEIHNEYKLNTLQTKAEIIAKLEDLAAKEESAGKYLNAANIIEKIIKLQGFYAPQQIDITKKTIDVSYGGWKPAMGLPKKPELKVIDITPIIEVKNKNSTDQTNDVEPLENNE